MKKVLILLLIAAAAAGYFFMSQNKVIITDKVRFSGTVEVTDVTLAFKVQGRVQDVLFSEGDDVKAGEEVARLENTDQKLAVETAQANVLLSSAALEELSAGSRKQEIHSAQANVEMAKAALSRAMDESAQAKSDRDRNEQLQKSGAISRQDFEKYDTAYKKSVNTVKEAEAIVKTAEEALSLTIEGTRSETIKKAHAALTVAQTSLMSAEQNLKYTSIVSPINGKVLTRPAEPGEYVQAGTVIMTVADVANAWVRGYISEKDLGRIKLGDIVDVKSDSYPSKVYKGRITYISDEAEFTPKTVQTSDERVNFMYRIKVSLDNRELELKAGMPVDGTIVLSGQ